ncbi:MAG: DUF2326 domain-containing protein [Rhodobacteraceae bacterium]|nr:DUF2326 domain-containing protein [Paracoccaceae bacterium]
MIHSVTSDLDTFKTLTFGPGLNIILADKTAESTDRQTRNGAGKSSFVELIHFIYGANADPKSIFRSAQLKPRTFAVRGAIGGHVITTSRSGAKPSEIRIQGATEHWPVRPKLDSKTGDLILSQTNWKLALGALLFDLPASEEARGRFGPTFRSLFPYFARRQNSNAFTKPTQQSDKQQNWDQRVAISYLLGLDANIPQQFQEARDQEKALKDLRKAAEQGSLGSFYGSAAQFRTRLTVAQDKVDRLRKQIATFNVVPEYAALEAEASDITRAISTVNNDNFIDWNLVTQLEAALESKAPPALTNVEKLYNEAGVVLPGTVGKRFKDVFEFHKAIVSNRRAHLTSEIEAAQKRIEEREATRTGQDRRRREIMDILQSGGALEHYTRMQEELGRAEAEAEALRQQLETALKIESTQTQLKGERARLRQALQSDHQERSAIVEEAVLVFENLSNALYEKAGSLIIGDSDNGPTFDVNIDSHRSKGINNMQIFCFDVMPAELATKRGLGPGFLIHDSHLFDGVDERQVAKALQLGASHAARVGFQYIVTLNSDALPKDGFQDDFDVWQHVNPTRLTDKDESGASSGFIFRVSGPLPGIKSWAYAEWFKGLPLP